MKYLQLLFWCLFAFSHEGLALDLDPNEIRGNSEGQPVAVLQNRYFLKAWRPEIGFMYGSLLKESYTVTQVYGGRLALFPSEWIGLEIQRLSTKISDSADRKALNDLQFRKKEDPNIIVTPDPEVNRVQGIMDYNAILCPFYGKMNFLDYFIVYSDLYVTVGGSKVDTDQGPLNAMSIGGGFRFYFAKFMSMRIDFRDRMYTEKRNGKETTKNNLALDGGLSFFLF